MSQFPRPDDGSVVARIRVGDAQAFEEVIVAYYPELLAYVARVTGTVVAAEDVLQDVFFRLWRAREQIVLTHGLRAYLYAAVRNQLLNQTRTEQRSRRAADRYRQEKTWAVDGLDALEQTEQTALVAAVRDAVAHLPTRAREVWQLHREQGLSYVEVAAVMEISVNTVKSQMARAVGLLRAALEPFLVLALLLHR